MESRSLAERYERLVKGRDLVRRAATLLSSGAALPDLLDELTALLNGFVDASSVRVRIAGDPEIATSPDSAIHIPIPFGGQTVGVLTVISSAPNAYDADDRALLETCALYLGARIHDEQQREFTQELARMATTDALTGLANRRGFDEVLSREWRRCARSQRPLALAILDVDFFKRFNDAYGHVAGDACLRQIAQALGACVKRPGDVVARYGGEEFAIVLPECDIAGAIALGESVCEAIARLAIPHEGSTLGSVTASIGVATVDPRDDGDPRVVVEAADAMLYAAKEAGRNRVGAPAYRTSRPAAEPRVVVRFNLPQYATPPIGRDRTISEVANLLAQAPIVTLVGPGGIGKTRVAVQVAMQSVEAQADGTWFADLAPLSDPDFIVTTLAGAIGLNLGPTSDPLSALIASIKPQRMLIVMDNCEHVIEGAAFVADAIASACPGVRVLATSREPLGVDGELLYRLDSLDDAAACELFVASARRGAPAFAPDAAEMPVVVDICRRLDGVALAIELAATRVRSISLDQLRARLDERFGLPAGGKRSAARRQQTLLASIAWSYDLISDRERAVLLRVSTFSGGFSLEAAVHVAGDEARESWEVVDTLAALVDKSMIAFDGGSKRYRLLESIKRFATERLGESGASEAARRAHALHFADVAAGAAATYGFSTQEDWIARYEPDLDNLRAAIDWSAKFDAPLGARIVADLTEYWDYCGLALEGLRRSEAALASLSGYPDAQIAPVQQAVAHLFSTVRSYRRGLEAGERALATAERIGDPYLLAKVRRTLGAMRYVLGEGDRGASELRLALEYFRTHENPLRRMGAIYAYALTLEPDLGRPLFLEALALAELSGWQRIAVAIEMNLSERDFWAGNVDGARARTRRAVSLSRNRRAPLDLAMALANLASYCCVAGAYDEAEAAAKEVAAIASAHEFDYSFAIAAQSLAVVRVANGNANAAAQLLGYVDAAFAKFGFSLERTEAQVRGRLRELLEARLDEATLARECGAGAALSMHEALMRF
jgi:diguanylate cyclase (GGDEF)-like protein